MKKVLLIIFMIIPLLGVGQNETVVDSATVTILDRMSDLIGDLGSCSFILETSVDAKNDHGEYEKRYTTHEVHFSGNNKMNVQSRGDNGAKGFWYDGETFSYLNYKENNYVTLEAPETTIEMIDSLHVNFDIKFPAADFFYPSLTDDILEAFDVINYLGVKTIDGEDCTHIMATNDTMTLQIWVSTGAMFIPKRYVIVEKDKNYRQFEGTFTKFKINPDLPDALFDFAPPRNARLISIMAKN